MTLAEIDALVERAATMRATGALRGIWKTNRPSVAILKADMAARVVRFPRTLATIRGDVTTVKIRLVKLLPTDHVLRGELLTNCTRLLAELRGRSVQAASTRDYREMPLSVPA